MRTRRSATALLAALVGVAALSACGSSGSTTGTSGSTEAPVTSTASSAPATSPSPTSLAASTSTSRAAAGDDCVAAHLKTVLGESGAAAGSRYQTITFTNDGTTACTLQGYPGVSLLDASGARIGQPAAREPREVAKVTLAARGGQANFFIHTTADLSGTGCQAASATIAVIAPNDTATMTVPGQITVCGTFAVSPVMAGTTGNG